ncbi:ribose 5-phosphate isomerase B [candidate division KSB1 bacterium]|nr:ribose 5-phosphate isomerase B [candidate division KSB1 bacterium]
MKIAVAADHAGFEFKRILIDFLQENGHIVRDFGCESSVSCDYPDYAQPAARSVASGENDRGILICSNGIGMCMVANRIPGVIAALVYNLRTAETTRKHHDSNVLCLGAKEFEPHELLAMVDVWLRTDFEGGRHERRINKVRKINE